MRGFQLWQQALAGDEEPLRRSLGESGIAVVATGLNSVFVVDETPDGGQVATVAVVGPSGGGSESFVSVPRSFRIETVEYDDARWIVRAADGRTVAATPGQFGEQARVLNEESNPRYEAHLEQAWHAMPRMYAFDAPWPVMPTVQDEALGEIAFDEASAEYLTTVEKASGEVIIRFLSADVERVRELLPEARRVLADYERIEREGVEYLWDAGADAEDTDADRTHFIETVRAVVLDLYYSGDFILNFEDGDAGYFMDGYWAAVHFPAGEVRPVLVTIEA